VVHCFDFYSNVLGVPAARLARVPAVIASQRDLGNIRPWHEQRIQRAMLRLATHVMVNSETIAERLARPPAARLGRVSVIRNGVDLGRFGPPATPVPRSPGAVVGVLANLRPEKGLRPLVEAAALVSRRVPGTRFAVWGEGPLRPELEARLRALELTDTVLLHGSTREPEHALKGCHLLVLPSLSEASSNVVLEAMATGLPVVATRVGGTPALVSEGQTGLLVPPGDPAALAEAIVRLIGAPGRLEQLGNAARARALAEFGMSRMLDRIDDLYCRVLGRGPRAVAPVRSAAGA
jgi:glycosyltransferase involved in cell wall biosynthesis